MIGKVLGNRYQLIEEIGTGGMALVYKARCSYLKRYVAVKVLKPEFSDDEEFIKRFKVEAQAAASLQHPNIVSIFDVGEENGIYYIVMEFIDGITLKEYIREKVALDWKEAARIAMQVCSAVKKAHDNKIIHRDIKPQNILITKDKVPKVTDFGIARAASCATVTIKNDTVASVHYSSPEQARGGYTDEKSDIYSIGVMLFEMLTGKLPFTGDSAVSVALKHIQDTPPEPVKLKKDIPKGINSIVVKAMQKSKIDRYQNVADIMRDIKKVVANPETKIISSISIEQANIGQTRKINIPEDGIVKTKKRKRKTDLIVKFTTAVLVVLILGILGYLVYSHVPEILPKPNPDYTVESFVGQDFETVKTHLKAMNIKVDEPDYVFDEQIEKGIIIDQTPEAGRVIKVGGFTALKFKVSKGKNLVEIPDIKYKEYLRAEILLRDKYGLKPVQKAEYSEMVGEGLVIRTEPEMGSMVEVGSKVIVYKSMGPKLFTVTVPDLTGLTLEEAKTVLFNSRLKLGYIYPEATQGHKGVIYDQEPKPGDEITEDTPVTLYFKDEDDILNGDGGSNIVIPGTTKFITYIVKLPEDKSYGNVVRLEIKGIPSTTEIKKTIVPSKLVSKEDFPLSVLIPVPDNGYTTISVYIDGVLEGQEDISAQVLDTE